MVLLAVYANIMFERTRKTQPDEIAMKKLLFLLAFACLPLTAAEETTQITGPLTADGYIDFFKALEEKMYPAELATDNNGFRLFVRQFGDASLDAKSEHSEFYRLQKYQKLGLDPNVPPTLTLPLEPSEVLKKFYEEKREKGKEFSLVDDSGKPWTLKEYPMLVDWIKEIDAPMDAVAEMIRKPIFFSPALSSWESAESGRPQALYDIRLSDVQLCRSIARTLQARATYRISQGNIDGAIDDKLTIHRLGRLHAQKGCLVQHLIGIAIEGMGIAIPVGANPEHPLTEKQIRRILDGLNALPPREPIINA